MTVTEVQTLRKQLRDARSEINELKADRATLEAQLKGDIPAATSWLQTKVMRQRAALDKLNSKVVTQRFMLRCLQEMGRSLSAEEFKIARERVENQQLRDRIDSDLTRG